MKIKDLTVGSKVDITLLVKEASILLTKGKKPYLMAQLTDGIDTIKSVDWDWGDKPAPSKNIVLDVVAEVTEYMGTKQLKLASIRHSEEGVEQYAPSGGVDVDEYSNKAKMLMDQIQNEKVRDIVVNAFNNNAKDWKLKPAANGIHHAYISGLLKHSVDVATKALALADLTPNCSRDLVIAGALLHDFGKIWTYQLNGAIIEMTDQGQLIEHLMLGAIKLESYRNNENSDILDLLQHIISSHHGELEYGSPTTPRCIEAVIVNFADGVDAKTQYLIELNQKVKPGDKLTEKAYIMHNRQMFTQQYIASIMEG